MTNPPSNKPSIGSQMARGVGWMMLMKLVVRSLGLVSTLILVRLLTPVDFGIVAMAMVFISVLEVLSWFSFDMAIIQHKNPTPEHYDTAWTFNLIFKCCSALILILGAVPIANYYEQPEVATIVWLLAGGVIARGFENVGIVDFRKNMEFDKEFRFMLIRKVAAFAVTVPLAFWLRNYWALIAGMLTGQVASVIASYVLSPYRPKLSLAARDHLFNFSKWIFLANLGHAVRNKTAELLIGRVAGAPALGLYMVSFEISNLPTTEMVAPINRVVFPGFAKISHSMSKIRDSYVAVTGMIALFAIPAGVGIAATSPLLVPVALGDQWLEAIPLISLLALFGVLISLQANISSLLLALGNPRMLAILSALHAVVLLAMAIPALYNHGVIGVAISYIVSTLVVIPINFSVLLRAINLPVTRLLSCLYRPVFASASMYASVVFLREQFADTPSSLGQATQLAALCVAGALIYVTVNGILWFWAGRPSGSEQTVLASLRRKL